MALQKYSAFITENDSSFTQGAAPDISVHFNGMDRSSGTVAAVVESGGQTVVMNQEMPPDKLKSILAQLVDDYVSRWA